MKITGETITDEQIRELRKTARYADGDPDFVIKVCNRALDEHLIDGVAEAQRTIDYLEHTGYTGEETEYRLAKYIVTEHEARVARARARCAEILNARAEGKP